MRQDPKKTPRIATRTLKQGEAITVGSSIPWLMLERVLIVSMILYLLSPFRGFIQDMILLGSGALLTLVFPREHMPEAPVDPGDGRASRVLWVFSALSLVAMACYGLLYRGQGHELFAVSLTALVYLPFAFLQEYGMLRYFLLRHCTWIERALPRFGVAEDDEVARKRRVVLVSGILFGLFHLPFPDLVLPTMLSGAVWAWCYLNSGKLTPIVLSHAVLGTSLFFTILERQPFDVIRPLLGS